MEATIRYEVPLKPSHHDNQPTKNGASRQKIKIRNNRQSRNTTISLVLIFIKMATVLTLNCQGIS